MNLSSTCGYSPRPPVSVYGTGACHLQLSGFSREYAPRGSPLGRGLAVLSGFSKAGGLPSRPCTYALQRALPSARTRFAPPSPPRSGSRCRNLHRLPIGLALRLILRTRLTLIRLALIRNPWSSGGRVSRPPSRYGMLPYRHPKMARGFGKALHARLLSMPAHSTSELLRTL